MSCPTGNAQLYCRLLFYIYNTNVSQLATYVLLYIKYHKVIIVEGIQPSKK